MAARRENKKHEDSGTIAEPDDDLVQLEAEHELDIDDSEESKQGNSASLGSNNAEVYSDLPLKTNSKIKIKDALMSKPISSDAKIIENTQQDNLASPEEVHAEEVKQSDMEAKIENPFIETNMLTQPAQNEELKEFLRPENQTGNDVNYAKDDEVNLLCEDEKINEVLEPVKKSSNYKYDLLDLLFSFILRSDSKKSEQINAVLSGYLQKVVLVLLNYKQKEVMNYIYNKEGLMDKLLEHVYDKSICDIIIKVLNISNQTTQTNNNSVNNDSGEIFRSPRCNVSQREESVNYSTNYEASRNEIINKLIDKLIRAKEVEEYWNTSAILCEMAKFSQLFEFLSSLEIMDKISIGLENDDEEGIKHTLKLYNVILREYSKDGTNKRINISNLADEGEEDTPEQDNDNLELKLDGHDDLVRERNSSVDKSADQSGSNLSKSVNVKENDKEKQFLSSITTVLPLIVQLINDDVNPKYIDSSFKPHIQTFGGMKLEAVEMIRIITSKF